MKPGAKASNGYLTDPEKLTPAQRRRVRHRANQGKLKKK